VYCSKCGNTLADNSAFCNLCGQATYAAPIAIGLVGGSPPRPYAGFWLRFVAYVIDVIVLGILSTPIVLGAGVMMGVGEAIRDARRGGSDWNNGLPPSVIGFIALCGLIGLVGTWLYHALLESSEWQGTLGKKVMSLEVTDLAGARVSFGRATGRHFAKFITSLIPLFIGYILAGFTEKRQAVHDMLAGSLVLRKS
jgi:uncharacterized RDD family membrane protein YckC